MIAKRRKIDHATSSLLRRCIPLAIPSDKSSDHAELALEGVRDAQRTYALPARELVDADIPMVGQEVYLHDHEALLEPIFKSLRVSEDSTGTGTDEVGRCTAEAR